MHMFHQRTGAWRPALAALLCAALVAACGGGDAPTGSSLEQPASYSEGPIEGFGSIIVGGVRYDDTNAVITDDDDNPGAAADLRLGVVVEIEGGAIDHALRTARALRVRYGAQLVGPIDSVDAGASTLVVLGQTVVVGDATVFDDDLAGGLGALAAGDVLAVHAQIDTATGNYLATRIDARDEPPFYRLRGPVADLDTTAQNFRIGSAVISYASVDPLQLTHLLAEGARVQVRMQKTQVDGAWVAVAVRSGQRNLDALGDAQVNGIIGRFESGTRFWVNGIEIDAAAADFPDGSAGIVAGARVEVAGTLVDGVLVASRVELFERDGDSERFELHGAIASIDHGLKVFSLRGVGVDFESPLELDCRATLAVGTRIEVDGRLSADRTRLVAVRIRCET